MIIPDIDLARRRSVRYDENLLLAKQIYPEISSSKDSIGRGIASFAISRGFLPDDLMSGAGRQALDEWIADLNELVGSGYIHNAGSYVFSLPVTNLDTLKYRATRSARLTSEFVGTAEIFQKREDRSEQLTRFTSNIDNETYLSLKGSTGVGNFAADLAIGASCDGDWARTKGEMWRVGFDIIEQDGDRILRILRAGSAMSRNKTGSEAKRQLAESFRRKYGISVSRALALGLLLTAHADPEIDSIYAATLDVYRDRTQTLGRTHSSIKFDYETFWHGFGFDEKNSDGWMTLSNNPDVFYDSVLGGSGMHGGEQAGVSMIIDKIQDMKSTRTDTPHALPALSDHNDPTEVLAAMRYHRRMNRGE